ncbi:MAG: chitobiase/beta-hexosaminidase C-terminal domain-containing protein [Butyrivibrio sp.]|nr:chitobiase/beta-hexosaminidase C-terminal domain-containing protein [Butyrivibrio sp.]
MKCPNCGMEIPEGHMYCDTCGKEINFVPDFDPEVENQINATLSGVADELNKEERLKKERREKILSFFGSLKDRRHIVYMSIIAVILIIAIIAIISSVTGNSPYSYLRAAEREKNAGRMDAAIGILQEGNSSFPKDAEIIFRLSDYYLENGDSKEAVEALKKITDTALFPDETVATAYESIISIYKQDEELDDISDILNSSDNEIAASIKEKYIPQGPVMNPVSGEYDDYVVITLEHSNTSGQCKVFYTVNGDKPDSTSILYENEIVVDTPGEYDIKAVCINEYGISSEVVQNIYTVVDGLPAEPVIMEPSGDYNQNTMIVAVAEEGCTIFYTTDGTDPDIDSKQYVSPITMPVGTTHYKFVAINVDGEKSEIVERNYHLVFTRLVSTEQAVNSLVSTLVRLDYLLDNTGKVRGLDGHNEYIYSDVIEIAGAGEYYVIVENHVSYDGISSPTGLIYAVNTHDGSVNRLGYDSSGKYTLIKISNR